MNGSRVDVLAGQPWFGWVLARITGNADAPVRLRIAPDRRADDLPDLDPDNDSLGWSDEHDARRNNFDVLRFLFAALVVLSHSYSMVLPKAELWREPLLGLTLRQVSVGTLCVYGFFAISGFLIARSWARSRSFGDFLQKRALRLYPGFAAMTLFCAFVVVPLATASLPHADLKLLGKLAYRVLVFDAWEDPAAFAGHETGAINASAWTIPYEFWCYMALAAVATAGALRRRWLGIGLFVAAYALFQAFALWNCGPMWSDVLPKSAAYHLSRIVGVPAKWPEFLTYFFAGMLMATCRDRVPHSAKLAAASAAVLVAAATTRPLLQFALPVCGVYLLFWVALHPRLRFERFGRHGDFSYGIYLYAFPIQQLIIKWIGPSEIQPLQLFALSMPLALLAGVASWHGVEKWFVHRVRKAAPAQTQAGGTDQVVMVPVATGNDAGLVQAVRAPMRIGPSTPLAQAA